LDELRRSIMKETRIGRNVFVSVELPSLNECRKIYRIYNDTK
jgi:hypothetical protein